MLTVQAQENRNNPADDLGVSNKSPAKTPANRRPTNPA
jgi:hypothetical protein